MSENLVKILIVDDGLVTRTLLERKLSLLGFEVLCASDGMQALQILNDAAPSAVITDLNMPNLDGLGLCREMRLEPRLSAIPVILTCSKEITSYDVDEARAAGAVTFVPRTPNLQEVLSAVRDALRANAVN